MPAAFLSGFTLCGQSSQGMSGRSEQDQQEARRLKPCISCQQVAHGAPPLHGHPAMIGG
jgi:hypothetical protein